MKWIHLILACILSSSGFAMADEPNDSFSEESELLALDMEIEDMLEEETIQSIDSSDPAEDYDDLEIANLPTAEQKPSPIEIQNQVNEVEVEEMEAQSLPLEIDQVVASENPMIIETGNPIETMQEAATKSIQAIEINLKQVFAGSPIIYSILFFLSVFSVCIWLYSIMTIRSVEFLPKQMVKELRTKLVSNQFDEALDVCVKEKHFFCKMLASGILARKHGLNVMIDTMKSEGKRSTVAFWQRIGILNEIAVIAPMLGLLGTVMGMFYAFYDLNRSVESVSLLFDGLGISVGTTVAGLIVAILAMILHSLAKYRLVRILASVENEAQTFAALIDSRGAEYLGK